MEKTTEELYGDVVSVDDFDVTERADIFSYDDVNGERKRGTVARVDNDNLCDIYSVFFDGEMVGEIEVYNGNRVLCCPDCEGIYDDVFEVARELV